MRDPLFWLPIKYKLPLTFAGLCLFALGIGGYVVASSAEEALEAQILLRLDELSAVSTIVVDRHLELLGRRVEDFASDGFIRNEVAGLLASREADHPEMTASALDRLERHLVRNKLPLVEAFVDAFLLDRQGVPVLQVYSHEPPPRASWQTANLWFGPLAAESDAHPYPTFLISTPLTSLERDRQVGFLQILVRADVWAESLRNGGGLPSFPTLRIWLEDTKGSTLGLTSTSSGAKENTDVSARTGEASPVLEYATTISRNGWRLRLEVDRDPVMEPVTGLLRRIVLVGVVLLLLIVVIWFFPARFLLRPLATLQDAARRVAEGDFSTRVTFDSRDEVGDLSRSFNIMAAAVEERTGKLEEAAAVLTRRESDIRFERDRLNAVIGSMHDGLFILDLKGEVTLSNAASQGIVTALRDGGGRLRRLDCRCGDGQEDNCLRCLADLDNPHRSCIVNVDSRTYEIHATTLAVAGGQRVGRVLVSRDISERIAQSERQAHQERMSVLGEIGAVMAHELNNPLAAIAMFSQMLETGLEPGSSFREHAEVIRRNTESCKRTIRGLLDVATVPQPAGPAGGAEVCDFDVHDLLDDVGRFLRPLYERAKVSFTLLAAATNSTVVGDELQLRQVIVNLVMNAIQAAESGPDPDLGEGAVSVTVATEDSEDNLAILVSDTGPGIPAEVRVRLFEPFFSTKPPGVGTGLGLSTSKRIVEAHGGTLELLTSEVPSSTGSVPSGTGSAGHTVFRVLLPREGRRRFRQPAAGVFGTSRSADVPKPTGEVDRG